MTAWPAPIASSIDPEGWPAVISTTTVSDDDEYTEPKNRLAAAGGIAATGGDSLIVTGIRNGKPFRREIDVVAMSEGSAGAEDLLLSGGDTVFVNRAPQFYIYGQVQKPGQVRLEHGMTVMQALASGGGVTGKGTSRGIVRHRRDASGKVKEESVSLDDDVRDQDVIYVKESLF